MNEQEFSELAAGHALHALSDADQQRLTAALAAHPEWQATLDAELETASALGAMLTPIAPPAALRENLLAQIATTPQAAPVASEQVPAPGTSGPGGRRWNRMLFALAACLVLLVGAGIGTAVVLAQLQRPEAVVALEQILGAEDADEATVQTVAGGTATAHWSDTLGTAVLVTHGLDDLPADASYELWFVRGDQPIAAGVFDTSQGEATALLDQPMQPGDAIAVTIEAAGGSPTGQPTTDPVIVIPTS
ncbi:anti-sigma factor [Microbacterium esteraromaticum]|uniref:Regulator of SigK n=1 Tax=Microbacterium esteraromaticum TaxID=57043 RepID=A0A939IW52_9MICO|nr:anti-sigma factor [Microbacterium esteraromaticum]MBN8206769.1 anti-sigma factor [Microbacterium esteraromaticum]MBN8416924.1 anti-sigma factor [Microbacterium esteraromaticum]MCA1307736.1 anti-sigma factor [Microbacterium esteraromaticum]WDH78161.1 anti-sigma factor [Microbacterium esteraromaticum]